MTTNNSVQTHSIISEVTKVDDTMDDTMPLLVATPLYGTEPETVTFDESAVIPATATTIGGNEDDPLLIRGAPSTDYSAATDKPEEPVYRDVPFALLFLAQFVVTVVLGFTIAPKGYEMLDFAKIKEMIESDPSSNASDVQNFENGIAVFFEYIQVYPERVMTFLFYPTSLLAFFIALVVTTKIIRPHPQFVVTACLVGAFVDAAIIMAITVISAKSIGSVIFATVVLSVVAYYIRSAWRLIPHSAINLRVSLDGIHSNCGIYFVALCLAEIGFLWLFYWFYVLVGTMLYVGETKCPGMSDDEECVPQSWTFLFMILSYYWTSQVISVSTNVLVTSKLPCFVDAHNEGSLLPVPCFRILFK